MHKRFGQAPALASLFQLKCPQRRISVRFVQELLEAFVRDLPYRVLQITIGLVAQENVFLVNGIWFEFEHSCTEQLRLPIVRVKAGMPDPIPHEKVLSGDEICI